MPRRILITRQVKHKDGINKHDAKPGQRAVRIALCFKFENLADCSWHELSSYIQERHKYESMIKRDLHPNGGFISHLHEISDIRIPI